MKSTVAYAGFVRYVDGDTLYGARGRRIEESTDGGRTWRVVARLPIGGWSRLKGAGRLVSRFWRARVHHIVPMSTDSLAVIGFGQTFSIGLRDGSVQQLGAVRGSAPLVVDFDGRTLCYGEYRRNAGRTPVAVWSLAAGNQWERRLVLTSVRHIHGVFWDKWSSTWWLTTGDHDSECGIWRSSAAMESLDLVVGGSQQARAVQLVFTPEYVYFGSDTPLERNAIWRMRRDGDGLTRLSEVDGSVFFGTHAADMLFFTTACEPSDVNRPDGATLWGSADGCDFHPVLNLKKDRLDLRFFQYGQILFPHVASWGDTLWISPIALSDDHISLGFSLADLRGDLNIVRT